MCTCGGADSVRTVFLNLFLFLSVSVQSMSCALGNSLRLNRASLSSLDRIGVPRVKLRKLRKKAMLARTCLVAVVGTLIRP